MHKQDKPIIDFDGINWPAYFCKIFHFDLVGESQSLLHDFTLYNLIGTIGFYSRDPLRAFLKHQLFVNVICELVLRYFMGIIECVFMTQMSSTIHYGDMS